MTLKDFFSGDRFAQMAGIRLVTVSEGYARAEMPVTPVVLNASGWVQGGALFTLADLAFAAAVNTHGNLTVSVNSNIAFFKSVRPEATLYAEARELIDHHRLPYGQVRITDNEGDLVAIFTSSGYRKSKAKIEVDRPE